MATATSGGVSTQIFKSPKRFGPKVHHFPKYFHVILWKTFFWTLKIDIDSTCGVQELKEFRRAVSKALEKEPNAPLPM